MARTLYRGNDHDLEIPSIVISLTEVEITNATVTWALLDANDTELGTGSLTYDGTREQYEGAIPSSDFDDQAIGAVLKLKVTATSGGYNAEWLDDRCTVKARPFEV